MNKNGPYSLITSPHFGYDTNYTDYLGGIERNATGHVVGAKAVRNIWVATFDPDKVVKSTDSLREERAIYTTSNYVE